VAEKLKTLKTIYMYPERLDVRRSGEQRHPISRNVNTVETSVYLFLIGVAGKLTGEWLLGLRVHEHDVLTYRVFHKKRHWL
jgi:hypothetical protein